jgi:hypothetical protein
METVQEPLAADRLAADRVFPIRVSALGVIAGLLVSLAFALLLLALGEAIGVTTAMRPSPEVARGIGIGFGAWVVLTLIVSAFAGGWVAAAAARTVRRRDGVLHGLLTWSAVTVLGPFLVGRLVRGMIAAISQLPQITDAVRLRAAIGSWSLFAALLLPLLAAIAGGAMGAKRERRVVGLAPAPRREIRSHKVVTPEPPRRGDVPPVPPTPVPQV